MILLPCKVNTVNFSGSPLPFLVNAATDTWYGMYGPI